MTPQEGIPLKQATDKEIQSTESIAARVCIFSSVSQFQVLTVEPATFTRIGFFLACLVSFLFFFPNSKKMYAKPPYRFLKNSQFYDQSYKVFGSLKYALHYHSFLRIFVTKMRYLKNRIAFPLRPLNACMLCYLPAFLAVFFESTP